MSRSALGRWFRGMRDVKYFFTTRHAAWLTFNIRVVTAAS
jgi:hypothetical protein